MYVYRRDSFGLRNTKECSMTYRQSETYSHKNASKTYHSTRLVFLLVCLPCTHEFCRSLISDWIFVILR